MATQIQNFAYEEINDARAMKDIVQRVQARRKRWDALGFTVGNIDPVEFTGMEGLSHLTPQKVADAIATFDLVIAAMTDNQMGNLERLIP